MWNSFQLYANQGSRLFFSFLVCLVLGFFFFVLGLVLVWVGFFQKINETAGKINYGYKITSKTSNSSSSISTGKELDDGKQLDTGKELDN